MDGSTPYKHRVEPYALDAFAGVTMIGVNSPIKATDPWESGRLIYFDTRSNPTWELIEDPSDSMIIGGVFGIDDIIETKYRVVHDCWVPGTRFKNLRSGRIMEVYKQVKSALRARGRIYTKVTLRWREVKTSDQLELKGM